jgi:photosystem II stability/assembly factor-like uncharacterized protein
MKKINILIFLLVIGFTSGYSQNWEKIYTGYNYILRGIEFPEGQSQIGYAAGEHQTYNPNGIVIKTTDGGATWNQLWFGTLQGLEGISFTDLNTGYVCGWSHYFAKTTDGGVTWTPQNPGSAADVWYYDAVKFKDALHGVVGAAGNVTAKIYATSDGGTTWVEGTGLTGVPYSICYVSDNTYFLATNGGDIQKSTDGGLTWNTVASGFGLLLGINFYNPMIGIATGEDGWLYKTFDGGATWTPQQTAYGNPLWRATAWKNQNELIMCGTPETVWSSNDGGANWINDYPTSSYNGAMYDILHTSDDIYYICGSQGFFYRKVPLLTASFTASNSLVCVGNTVQFTDQSVGNPTSWNWTFEGGNPATSTLQNPLVTYSTPGIYDVTLQITRGTSTNTITNTDYIHVESPVTAAPTQPTGQTAICTALTYDYTTTPVAGATSYIWTVDPASAGTFSGTGTTATLTAASNWYGPFTITVAGTSACGTGSVSAALNCALNHQPNVFSLFSGGGYCAGQPGYEIQLENSETGVDYQLYKDGIASGTPVAGTGTTLSFGYQTVGTYTVVGANGSCLANMQGSAVVYIIDPVAAATQPTGPVSICNDEPATYSATLPANGYTLVWTVTPSSAGTITQPTTTTALVTWNTSFSGTAAISVQGQNECGNGAASPALNVSVNPLPVPAVSGIATVCKNQEITYNTASNTGSTYVWAVTGGTITSGQGSSQLTVLWGNPGTGTVKVTETSAAGCNAISPVLSVAINECTGINEYSAGEVNIYPNPASEVLNVVLGSSIKTPVRIVIYNHLGQAVYQSAEIKSATTSPLQIDINHLTSGTYSIMITGGNEVYSKLFVKK